MLNAFNDVTFLSEDQKSSRSGKERNRCAINEGEGIFEDFFWGSIRGILFALFLRPSIAFCFWYRLEMFSALIFLLLCFSAFCCFCAFLCFLILYFLASLLSAFFFASLLFFFSLFCFSCFSAFVLVCFSAFFTCLLFFCFFCCPVSCDQERKRLPAKLDKIIQKSSKHQFHTISLYSSLG
jgi:hypothetical protein